MANWYVYSGAAGTGTGADWTNAKTTLAAAISASSAGDTFYVAHDHAETQATTLTLTFKGTLAAPDTTLCVNRAGSVPPVAADLRTTATVSVTGVVNITLAGSFYIYGVTFQSGSAANTSSIALISGTNSNQMFDTCGFVLNNTSTSSRILLNSSGSGGCKGRLVNCTYTFGSTSQFVTTSNNTPCDITLQGGSVSGSTFPSTLFSAPTCSVKLAGVDLSALGSGKTLVGAIASTDTFQLVNCKLGASVTVAATTAIGAASVDLIGCHSSSNVERNERYRYQGTLTTETTIKRTAGASDGTTAYSWKIVSTANAKRTFPFETFEGAIWNDVTGSSKTLTVHTVIDNVTLQDADIWLEVEYLGSSAAPVTSLISSAPATQLTPGSNLTSDSGEAWTTTGLTTPVKQKFSVTFTPQMAGPIRWKVKVAKASATVYVCPKAELS